MQKTTGRPDAGLSPDHGQGPPAGLPPRARARSFGFLERGEERWAVFLVTFQDEEARWRGYLTFRRGEDAAADEIRTADLWVETSEAELDARARGLGRPLLSALLDSALDIHERRKGYSEATRRWFRQLLSAHAASLLPDIGKPSDEFSLANLRSLYDSYRIDQVAHLIMLIPEEEFRLLVERVLHGKSVDFRTRDRLQLSMAVIQELEAFLPLPPFEIWTDDFLSHREEYHRYSHALHREGRLT